MASFDSVEKAVRLKVEHLKDKAKLETLSTKLSTEFNAVKDTLKANAAAIPSLVQGFHGIQIHEITKNAEVKEEAAKQQLETKVDELIAMLKNPPAASTQTAGTNTDSSTPDTADETPVATASDTSASTDTTSTGNTDTANPETTTQTAALSETIKQEAHGALQAAKTEMQSFNPTSMQDTLDRLPAIETKLDTLIASAGSVANGLPAGADKTAMEQVKNDLEAYKAELIKNKQQIIEHVNTPFAFLRAKPQLETAKQDAADLITRFEAILNK